MSVTKYQQEFRLKTCPWCDRLPHFSLVIDDAVKSIWHWSIGCEESQCTMKPQSRFVTLTGKEKYEIGLQVQKIQRLVYWWNRGNPRRNKYNTTVEFLVDVDKRTLYKRDNAIRQLEDTWS